MIKNFIKILELLGDRLGVCVSVYAEPEIREPIHFEVFFLYFTQTRYGIQVNIEYNPHAPSPVCPTGVVHVLLQVEVT